MLKVTAADFNDSGIFQEMRIYNSTTPFTPETLPDNPKIVTVQEIVYEEGELPNNVRFYYMVETVTTTGSRFSKLHSMILWADNGYSVQGKECDHLIAGDADLGYFGTCPLDGLPDIYTLFDAFPDIKAQVEFAVRPYDYSKYVIDGRVIYFPHSRQVSQITIRNLYTMGLVFKNDAEFEALTPNAKAFYQGTGPVVPQGKTMQALGYEYRVRLVKNDDLEGAGRAMFNGWKTGAPGYLWANTALEPGPWGQISAWMNRPTTGSQTYLLDWASGYTNSYSQSNPDAVNRACLVFEYVGKVTP